MAPILEIYGLGKKYRILTAVDGQITLRDVIVTSFKKAIGFFAGKRIHLVAREFWAVNDVSFTIRKGEVMAIIGRNGSGKSTILKILSGITLPTEGRVVVRGKITSLLEVGTGFHPELSGRENIFLNAALLGMSRKEIYKRYDAIVEYSGVKEFIDVPVKKYSSGMFVRLAFSIAVHIDPEILILDEVLSVGDIEFQQKGFETIEKLVHKEGVTVILVSHSLDTVAKLADRIAVIDKGRLVAVGEPEQMIATYKNLTEHA